MPLSYSEVSQKLLKESSTWLVTGGAGFIGSNLVERLLELNQKVVVLDNLSTGYKKNLEQFINDINFIEGDVSNYDDCLKATSNVDYVLHQAALGSVPRSIKEPLKSHKSNVTGQLNMLEACSNNKIKSMVYASSSSVYGDSPGLPKVEEVTGNLLSPYSATKKINEMYAQIYSRTYNLNSVGLRYFNVFGKKQDPDGPYAAVIPLWIKQMIGNSELKIFGDGSTSRDFCFIENVIQANILAAYNNPSGANVLNISYGGKTSLNELFKIIRNALNEKCSIKYEREPVYEDFRPGDIKHSQASIEMSQKTIGYEPVANVNDGILDTIQWYVKSFT